MFRDKAVLITGASSGIGQALAERFAACGARTAIVARRRDRLDDLAERIAASGHPRPVAIEADLFIPETCARVTDQARTALGGIDVLINNAGLGNVGPFADATEDEIRQMLDLNVAALLRLTQLVLPEMRTRQSGWIMNVGSTAGYQAMPYMGVYAATKAFVLSFSHALWAELRREGIAVTCVNPGTTRTEFFDHHPATAARDWMLRQAMSADRVADLGIRALARGKPMVVCGLANACGAFLTRLLPRRTVTNAIARLLRPRT